MELVPYLTFKGDCAAAFKFYEKCLGGKIEMMMTNGESPMAEQIPAEQRNKVMHARLSVGGKMLMGSDAPSDRFEKISGVCVSLSVDKPAEAERVFGALSANGTVTMPLQETFWAQRFGMLTDQFGVPWMINCEKPM